MNKSVVFMQHFLPCDKLGSEALEMGPGKPAAQAQAQAQDFFRAEKHRREQASEHKLLKGASKRKRIKFY